MNLRGANWLGAPLVFASGETKAGNRGRLRLLLVGQALILVQQGVYESICPNKLSPLDTVSTDQASHAEVFTGPTQDLGAFNRRVHACEQCHRSRRPLTSCLAAGSAAQISDSRDHHRAANATLRAPRPQHHTSVTISIAPTQKIAARSAGRATSSVVRSSQESRLRPSCLRPSSL